MLGVLLRAFVFDQRFVQGLLLRVVVFGQRFLPNVSAGFTP